MFNIDKKYLYIIIAVLAILSLRNLVGSQILITLLTIPGVLIAITFHEYAHAYAAVKLGDETPRFQGRLTLNPLKHLDPLGIILLLFVGIGWGKPVEINPRNFDGRVSLAKAESIVSFAGPLANFIISIILTAVYFIILKFFPNFVLTNSGGILATVLQATIMINIGLGVFNLIPLPPLDGSKIFFNFLPYKAKRWLDENTQFIYMIFMVLWITGILGYIISPIIRVIVNGLFYVMGLIFNLF